jgi:putative thioredoxin
MLELGQSQTPEAGAGDLIKDGTEATFMADVIEGSRETPVIVDFWATWCGPCKTLGPMLEAAVTAAKGKVRMVKIDVDKEQRLAGALAQQGLPLQSIPTVVAFFGGQPVDMFQGAVPQGQINEFVNKLAAMAGDGGLGEAVEAAEQMLAEGAVTDAAQTFAAILGEEPENAAAMAGLARAHIAMGQLDQAEALLNNAPESYRFNAPEIEAVRAQIALARQAENAGPWVSFPPPWRRTRAIIRHGSTMPKRCMRPDRSNRPSSSCWNCSAVTASGTTVRPRRSFSRSSTH